MNCNTTHYRANSSSVPGDPTIGASGVILAAVYLLILYQRMFWGPITHAENSRVKDLNSLEIGILVPMVILCVWIGFQPNTFLSISESSSRAVVGVIERLKGIDRYAEEAGARLKESRDTIVAPVVTPGAEQPLRTIETQPVPVPPGGRMPVQVTPAPGSGR